MFHSSEMTDNNTIVFNFYNNCFVTKKSASRAISMWL